MLIEKIITGNSCFITFIKNDGANIHRMNKLAFHRMNKPAYMKTLLNYSNIYVQYWENNHYLKSEKINK